MLGVGVVALSIVFLRLPVLFGSGSTTSREALIRLVPFVLVAGARLLEPADERRRPSVLPLLWLFVLLLIAAEWRGVGPITMVTSHQAQSDTIAFGVLAAFGYCVFVRDADRDRVRKALIALCFAPACYVLANVILRYAHVRAKGPAVITPATNGELMKFIGLHHPRTVFPLGGGVNNFGLVVGIALALSMILALRFDGRIRKAAFIAAAASLYAIFLTDSRGALVSAIAAVILVQAFGSRRAAGRLQWLSVVVPLSPIIAYEALTTLGGGAANLEGRGSFATGSNRLFIWKPILDYLQHVQLSDVFGYGIYGELSSGVERSYAYLFSDVSVTPGAHNFALQTVLDMGYVGLAVAVALFVVAIRGLVGAISAGELTAWPLLAGVIYLIFIGFTESAPTLYTPELLLFFVLAVTAMGAVEVRAPAEDASRPHSELDLATADTAAKPQLRRGPGAAGAK